MSDRERLPLRFAKESNVLKHRHTIDETLADFLQTAHNTFGPEINQAMVFDIDAMRPAVTDLHSPRLTRVAGVIASAAIEMPESDTTNFDTFKAIDNSYFLLQGTRLGRQIQDLRDGRRKPLTGISGIDRRQEVIGLAIDRPSKTTQRLAQVAVTWHTPSFFNRSRIETELRGQWEAYSPAIEEEMNSLRYLYAASGLSRSYLEALELNTPKSSPNSIAVSFDLIDSTSRALDIHDGTFNQFMQQWKDEVQRIVAATKERTGYTMDLIGDEGDGHAIIFWLNDTINPHDALAVDEVNRTIVTPFRHQVKQMSEALASLYEKDLGPLRFNAAVTPSFVRINSTSDISSRGLWENSLALKQDRKVMKNN